MGRTSVDASGPRIHVVGCGGAGTNTVHRLSSSGVRGVRTVAVNTDKEHLWRVSCDQRVLLGDGAVRGTGGRPEIGARLAAFHEKEVRAAACGGDLTFVIAGLGGGTGTGLAPLVANWARIGGATVVGVATMPFRAEVHRQEAARRGLEALRESCSSLIVLENDRLAARVPDLPVEQAFAVMDHMIGEVIRGLSDAVNERSLIQLDFPDLREIFREGGPSTILFGEGDVYAPEDIVASALKNTLLDVDYRNAHGAVLQVTSAPNVRLRAVDDVVEGIRRELRRDARIAFGVRTDPEFDGSLRMMAVVTGVSSRLMPPRVMASADLGLSIVR
ncbi:MAG: cell division protein FtsZ [Methanobacteriota archaeon]|nr:MAG: cell division protein FtsZ [Euryarchaeota archaeon]